MTLTTFEQKASKVYAWVQVGELNDTSDDGGDGANTGISNSRTGITVRNTRFNGEANSIGHRIEEGMEVLIDSEIMKVTDCDSRTDTEITVTRGEHTHAKIGSIGGAAAAHLTGAAIYAWSELKDLATGVPLIQHLTITESVYEPTMLELTLSHPPQTTRYGVGTLEGLIKERTPLKVVEGENFSVLFRGNINRITRQHALEEGNTLDVVAFDNLYEFGRSKIGGADADVKINGSGGGVVSVADGGLNQSVGSVYLVSDVIKAYIQRFQKGGSASTLGVGENITTAETVSGSSARFETSAATKESNNVNTTVNLGTSNTSVLRGITRLAMSDSHVNGVKFGYNYYLDPNNTSFSTGHKSVPVFNYFKSSFMPAPSQHTSPNTSTMNIDYDKSGGVTQNSDTRLMKPGASFDAIDVDRINTINVRYRSPHSGDLQEIEFEIFHYDKIKNTNNRLDSAYSSTSGGKEFIAPKFSIASADGGSTALSPDVVGVDDPLLRVTGTITEWQSRVVDENDNIIGYLQFISNQWGAYSADDESDTVGFALLSGTSTRRANSDVAAEEKLYLNKYANNDYIQLTAVTDPAAPNSYRPQAAANEKIMVNLDVGFIDNFNDIRQAVAAKFSQAQASKIRGRFQVDGKYPTTCFDQQALGADTIGTTTDASYTITEFTDASRGAGLQEHGNLGHSVSTYSSLGLRAGHSIAKLTGANGTVDTHGYLARVSNTNTGVDLTFKLNSGTISADDYFRLHVPVRAGHVINVESGFHNIAITTGGTCVVTSLVYYESGERSYTDFETLGLSQAATQEVIASPRPLGNNLDDYTDDDYKQFSEIFTQQGVAVPPLFTGSIMPGITSAPTQRTGYAIRWTKGILYYGGRQYGIAAGDSSSLAMSTADTDNDGLSDTQYILFFEPGASKTAFQFNTSLHFERRNESEGRSTAAVHTRPYSSRRLKIATCWSSKSNAHATASTEGALVKIFPAIQLGMSRLQDDSANYSSVTQDTDPIPPMIIGGKMLSGDVAHHWQPTEDDTYNLGIATGGSDGATGFRWKQLIAGTTTISTSDAREKINIKDNNLGLDFINDLRPVSFEWQNPKKTGSVHRGIVAQEVVEVLKKYGINDLSEFAAITKLGDSYGARYEEFVAPLIKAIQELSAKVEQLENEAKE